MSVNLVVLNPDQDVSLPPFADALRALEPGPGAGASPSGKGSASGDKEGREVTPRRDVLGEMEIAARVMITGGDSQEDARMSRADRLLIGTRSCALSRAE